MAEILPVRRKTLSNKSINQQKPSGPIVMKDSKRKMDFKFVQRKVVDQKQIITRMCKLNATFF